MSQLEQLEQRIFEELRAVLVDFDRGFVEKLLTNTDFIKALLKRLQSDSEKPPAIDPESLLINTGGGD
jgi:hypothetical protein